MDTKQFKLRLNKFINERAGVISSFLGPDSFCLRESLENLYSNLEDGDTLIWIDGEDINNNFIENIVFTKHGYDFLINIGQFVFLIDRYNNITIDRKKSYIIDSEDLEDLDNLYKSLVDKNSYEKFLRLEIEEYLDKMNKKLDELEGL